VTAEKVAGMPTFHFDLVSPEKIAFSGEVDQVDIPGAEGDFGVLANHAPVVAVIRPGILTVTIGSDKQKVVVLGGLAEVSEKGLTVLADVATLLPDMDLDTFAATITSMEQDLPQKTGAALDNAIARLDHFRDVQRQLSTTAMH
jgi:F-type H+-transporting ATPase subunit epsilon